MSRLHIDCGLVAIISPRLFLDVRICCSRSQNNCNLMCTYTRPTSRLEPRRARSCAEFVIRNGRHRTLLVVGQFRS